MPEAEGRPAFTKLFNQAAIYAITPVAERIARDAARSFSVRPIDVYDVPAQRQLEYDDDDSPDHYGGV